MSEQKYTHEPWKVDEYSAGYIWGKNMEMVADLDEEEGYVVRMRGAGANLPQEENAKRIVECVNALAGIENPREWVQWQKNIALANAQLQSENERLKAALMKVYTCNVDAKNYIQMITDLRGIAENALKGETPC